MQFCTIFVRKIKYNLFNVHILHVIEIITSRHDRIVSFFVLGNKRSKRPKCARVNG